jgi:hypothetical protein
MDLSRKFDRVAIVGFCSPHREWVPYEDPELEIWGLNRGYIFQQRMDRWFEMHGPGIVEWQQRRPGNHLQWLQRFQGPIYMHQARPELIPNSVDYPLLAVAADIGACIYRFAGPAGETAGTASGGPGGSQVWNPNELKSGKDIPYLSSSIAQEIALAIHMGYKEIWLYGIDLNTASEYAWQKPGVEFMLGLAAGRGIKVYVPEMCPLLQGSIYGRGYLKPEGEKMSPEQWMERIKALQADKEKLEARWNQFQGAKREIEWLLAQMVPGMDHEAMDQRRQQSDQAIQQVYGQVLQCVGALQETVYWAHQTPEGQNPREALGQLVAMAEANAGKTVDDTAALAAWAVEALGTNGHDSDGPKPDSLDWAIADLVPSTSGGELVPA